MPVEPPDLGELEPFALDAVSGDLALEGVSVEHVSRDPVTVAGISIIESSLSGVTLEAPYPRGLRLRDVRLSHCDLSNVDGGDGSLTRVLVEECRLLGFGLASGTVRDLTVRGGSLSLASFAFGDLRDVTFESVNLTDASFMEAKLQDVAFIGCELSGADFRGARLKGCEMRGTSLEGIVGLDALSGLRMPWADVINSAGVLATALGIEITED